MNKALQTKVTFAIDTSKYDMPSHNPYRRYNYVENSLISKKASSHNVYCHYCCIKIHTIAKCNFRRLLVPKGTHQSLPKCNKGLTNHQWPNEDWVPSTSRWSCRINVLALWKEYDISFLEAQVIILVTLLYFLTWWQGR